VDSRLEVDRTEALRERIFGSAVAALEPYISDVEAPSTAPNITAFRSMVHEPGFPPDRGCRRRPTRRLWLQGAAKPGPHQLYLATSGSPF
jgi:hypothetical protein